MSVCDQRETAASRERGDEDAQRSCSEDDAGLDRAVVTLGLQEGRNAVRLAQAADADKYAADSLAKAQASLDRAEDYYVRKQWKPVETAAEFIHQIRREKINGQPAADVVLVELWRE